MAFQSLYRRYRPQRFGDLVGQDPVATALRNTVREDRVGHAYLFSGPRGTGKTTTARILAKAVNCTALGTDGEPCGECENCRAVAAGTFGDLVELDAASNNGVEAIRDLIDRVHLGTGASTRRKVYLVDEVHMLSNAATNALLKTLEEPPGHVVFVLATTNPEKVLPTIRSRTQHFEFSLIPTDVLAGHLAGVLRSEGVEADPEALDALARAAAGSARDALSLLDQALAHEPDHLRAEAVASIFGRTPFERRAAILGAVAGEDAGGALAALQELLDSGHEPRRVAADLLQALRDAFVLVAAEGRVRVDLPDDEREALARLGAELGEGPL
ncbi:MAG: DNA polymerase III subunit gamma/tau, partial [Acidimicrobiia bacterium]|nr:DNA polymerase III subunit gamma/tau [Acidimicrobiia bacterium]